MFRRSAVLGIWAISLVSATTRAQTAPSPLGRYSISALGVAGQSTLTTFETNVDKGFAEVYSPVVETTMFISRRTELGISVNPWIGISQPVTRDGKGRERVSAFAADILLRWYPGNLSWKVHPYLEIADGPSYALSRVPSTGTQFNFLTQLGAGFLLACRGAWSLHVGYRLVHFSNAGLGQHNPSWNFNGLLLGGRWTFSGE
jgi:hypothetical protein